MFSSDTGLLANALPISIDFHDSSDLIETISLIYKRIANSVNSKEQALYTLAESPTFKLFYTRDDPQIFRNVYRKTFDMVDLNGGIPIPAGATVSFPHGITGLANTSIIYASVTTSEPRFFSFMYPNVFLTSTNVVVTNPDGAFALDQCDVIADYLKTT